MGGRKTSSGGRVRGPHRADPAALSVLLVFLASHAVLGLVTPTSTLWSLTAEADLVVLARVVTILPRPTTDLGMQGVAVLSVKEAWKGSSGRVIFVPFETLLCPNGPVYRPGETVVAFLENTLWLLPTYRTVGFVYGTRYPRPEEVENYRRMIRRAEAIQRRQWASAAARHTWHVQASLRPGTRWDGLYGLASWTSLVDWESLELPTDPARQAELTETEIDLIAEAFVRWPPVDPSLPMALALLSGHPDPGIDEAALAAVDELLTGERLPPHWTPDWVLDAIGLVLLRYGDTDPAARLAPLDESFHPIDHEAVRDVWEEARRELGMTDFEN